MIILYHFGRALGMPDLSPFVIKAELLLRMADLPYELNNKGFKYAPKAKLPYINDDGLIVADSTFIRFHLEQKYDIDFNKGLSGERAAVLWAAERMCEEHLGFGIMYDRWLIEHNFKAGPALAFKSIPALMRSLVEKMVKKKIKSALYGQGMGRHSRDEMYRLCKPDIGVLASLLGDALYFGGVEPCGADATFGAFIMGLLCPAFETQLRTEAESYANLVAYRDRMMERFYADLQGKK